MCVERTVCLALSVTACDPNFYVNAPVPSTATTRTLVVSLKDIHLNRAEGKKLIFYGLTGASWVLEYSRDILGLDVCVTDGAGQVIPIKGRYDTCSVVILPAITKAADITQPLTRPTDIIIASREINTSSTIPMVPAFWPVTSGTDGVDFFRLECGCGMQD